MEILLMCAGGISTSLLAKNMTKAAQELGIEATILAIGEAFDLDNRDASITHADVVLLAPQIRYLHKKIQEIAGAVPVLELGIDTYKEKSAKTILEMAILAIKNESI